ncbi:MAG: hypothetical protein A2X13_05025 [Bacteroidetes bacterium GWC2_33_15]|nr:MAG: hypothetical protein A2X10_12895 [Bacteroidetes bacterium GWA2_33_15]OFX50954.1 MAG: hypothetical protein A2X13_05025 [Bacteroidetes bacterium GWC2_33_15]OFX66540.1 MAG: hypothetical protein A2X15_15335 [Bacteroidetes bacterium GWB2_32_14]OFX70180.1 MAG: hypothetical protein A2X14_12785 [Bacteroidetes bacterium GWD2_33_33]HAN20006.1 methyltransferase [Bacteroidales bacterium]
MISRLNYPIRFIQYWLFAKHKKGHGIHSPFVFNLINTVFNKRNTSIELEKIVKIYNEYKKNVHQVTYTDLGAGATSSGTKSVSVGKIVKQSSVTKKYGQLLFSLIRYFKPTDILELGTSVGISTAYIGLAAPASNYTTIEGSDAKLKIAKQISGRLELKNIRYIHGEFDKILESVLNGFKKLDFVFFDGNHKKEPTLNYFNLCLKKAHKNTVFVFDDIHWSKEMEQAWKEIKQDKNTRVSIDLFQMGIVFFNDELSYQHYIIKF